MAFVNAYGLPGASRFRKTILTRSDSPEILAIGSSGVLGLAVRAATPTGVPIWARTYSYLDKPLEFVDGVPVGQEGFALLAGVGPALDPFVFEDYVLVRIDAAGQVLWSRLLSGGYGFGRVLHRTGAPDEFLVLRRVLMGEGPDARQFPVDLFRISANGDQAASARLYLPEGGRIFDAATVADGYVLVGDVGDTLSQPEWIGVETADDFQALARAGLVVHVDANLTDCTAWTQEGAGGLSLRSVLVEADQRMFAAGAAEQADGAGFRGVLLQLEVNAAGGLDTPMAVSWPLANPLQRPVGIAGGPAVLLGTPPGCPTADSELVRFTDEAKAACGFDFQPGARLSGLASGLHEDFLLCGSTPTGPGPDWALLLSAEESLECCRTHPRDVASTPMAITSGPGHGKLRPLDSAAPAVVKVTASAVDVALLSLCGASVGDGGDGPGERLLQSPHLILQAAGSDGTDASEGILLRWLFAGPLAKHLPRGDAAGPPIGFNKPADFVRLWRAKWSEGFARRRLSFLVDRPIHVDLTARVLCFETGTGQPRDLFVVTFLDATAFDAAVQTTSPWNDPAGLLAAYGAHPFEVELRNVLSLGCDLVWGGNSGAKIEVETCSVAENTPLAVKRVAGRVEINAQAATTERLLADNLRSVRLRPTGAAVHEVSFIAYADVLAWLNQQKAWAKVGDFALSTDQPTVFKRLEDLQRFQVHGKWRKFNGAFVNVQNYRDRWSDTTEGLGLAVQDYLQLSQTDPLAMIEFDGAQEEDGKLKISQLDLLTLVSFDFHIARMLGLGCVDPDAGGQGAWIYLAEYETEGDIKDGFGARPVQHLAMSLPTRRADARLPLVPDLDGVEYGLEVATGSGAPYALTDAEGYTPDGQARFVRLYPGCRPLYAPEVGFFDPPDKFDLSADSLPVFYGIEFRGLGEPDWRRPEIAHDQAFHDTGFPAGPEVVVTPFPSTQRARAFVHKLKETGQHEYAAYAVNLFSRPSALGAVRGTTPTAFKRRNTLLPPSGLLVQLIQPENPLVLTTQAEQQALAGLTGDPTLVRVCFNYGMVQDLAYDYADRIDIFHRADPPLTVSGGLTAIDPAADPALLRLSIGAYTYAGTPPQTAYPSLLHSLRPNFIGGALVAGGRRLVIEDVQWPSSSSDADPIFLVRKPTTTGAYYDPDTQANTLVIEEADLGLALGELVTAIENLSAAANWGGDNPLTKTVTVAGSDWTDRVETFARPDGSTTTRRLRGLLDTANIVSLGDNLYRIEFDTKSLTPHPQSGDSEPVNWWKGSLHAPVLGAEPLDRRALTVVSVDTTTQATLILHAVDDTGQLDPIDHGAARSVNYYPGYRVHLRADTAQAFDQANLFPAGGARTRLSLIGLRSVDTTTLDASGDPYMSSVGVPQILTATAAIEPLAPFVPKGLLYAAPPDADGKSSYTLTLGFQHDPFAVVVYRADALSILQRIYVGQTALDDAIDLLFPIEAVAFTDLFQDLLTFLDDTRTALGTFPPTGPDAVTLPTPAGAADKEKLKEDVLSAFTPLTEQPLIWERIRTDAAYVPTNRKQRFLDDRGALLDPNDLASGFDIAPMAKRVATPHTMMFTDFGLDGSMNAETLYFYFAREIGDRMKLGDPSPVFGPVKLVNLNPPAAPILRKIDSVPYDGATGKGPEVRFEVIAPPPSDPMAWLRLYRTSDPAAALSPRTMAARPDIALSGLIRTADGTLVVADDFAGEAFVPYGDPLFYRLAWVRNVAWQDATGPRLTQVVSQPTRTLLSNVIDVVNPTPPRPTLTLLSIDPEGNKFLRLTWAKAVHNGVYVVSRLTPSGTWERLAVVKTTTFDLPAALPTHDENGGLIYYRFKLDVEGPSGLVNTFDDPATVSLDTIV